MKQYRLAVLKKEFGFIDRLFLDSEGNLEVRPEDVTEIKIRKGDKVLLAKKGNEDSYDWSGGGHYDYTKYFAVWTDNKGEHILKLDSAGHSATGSGERHDWDCDTIAEQLFLKDITPDYIVECTKNDTDDNGNGEVTRFWIIYKMNKFDLATYHQQKVFEAAGVIVAEIFAACKD